MATTIKGDVELRRKLAKLVNPRELAPALKEASLYIKTKISTYPPSTAANVPGGPGSHWYQRGWGSKWMTMDGTVRGRNTSETLGKSWTRRIEKEGLKFIIGNDTSYGKFVQGSDDQAKALKRIGWKTTDKVVEEEEEVVLNQLKKRVDQILARG